MYSTKQEYSTEQEYNTKREYSTEQEYKILEFIDSIKNKDELQLTSVNCGIFAILLKDIFNMGKLVAIVGDLEPEVVHYVMFGVGDKYYDAQGKWTKEEIIGAYQKISLLSAEIGEHYDIIEIDENSVEKSTGPNMAAAELISMLKF
jgi:hypothetical protein